MRVSFVIPTLNEAEGVEATLRELPIEALRADGHEVEVLLVDGQSTDGTPEIGKRLGARVLPEPRLGYGRAYKTGFANARGDILVTGDADATYPFRDVPQFLRILEDGRYDFLTTNRFAHLTRGAMTAKHRIGNGILSWGTRALFGVRIRDSQSGMWILRRTVLDHLPIHDFSDGMPFSEELKIRAFRNPRLRCAEIPGRYHVRAGRAKLSSWKDGWRNLRHLWRMRTRRLRRGNGSA